MLALRREEAAAVAAPGQTPYDALLEEFEPGARVEDLVPVFARLRANKIRPAVRSKMLGTGTAGGRRRHVGILRQGRPGGGRERKPFQYG